MFCTECGGPLDANLGVLEDHAHRESRFTERAISTTGVPSTPCTTGIPHNGRSYHTLYNGQSA